MKPDVFVLGNTKRKSFTTAVLTNALRNEGMDAYAVTPHATPRYTSNRVRLIVNDGVSVVPEWWYDTRSNAKWLNAPWTVQTSCDKVATFHQLNTFEVPHLRYTIDRSVAEGWDKPVIVRHRTKGARGAGIEIVQPNNPLPSARLYTELFTGKFVKEYRAYIVGGKVIDIAMKMRRRGAERTPETEIIRSWGNDWIFARHSWERRPRELELITEVAEQAAGALAMGYGAVDLFARRWRDKDPDVVVIETNTHPGLDGSTPAIFAKAIKTYMEEAINVVES